MSEIERNRSLSDDVLCHQRTMMHQVRNDIALLASAVRLSAQKEYDSSDQGFAQSIEQRLHLLSMLYRSDVRAMDGAHVSLDVLLAELFSLLFDHALQGFQIHLSPERPICSYSLGRAFLFLIAEILLDYFDRSPNAKALICTLTESQDRWFCELRQEGQFDPLLEAHPLLIQAFTIQLDATLTDMSNLRCRQIVIDFKEQ